MPVSILIGDVFDRLAELPADSIDCCVTSPPYWGLRDYGVAGQIGLEPTLAEHLDVMVRVFDAVRRVLKPEGTLWLNYGDCYATKPNGRSAADTKAAGNDDRTFRDKPFSTIGGSLKPKDLCMIPNRLAIALQDAGWWVRSEIVWGKPNPMPDSSGRYRPSSAHEKIFLLTKSAKSHYDAAAVRMPAERDVTGTKGGGDLHIGSNRKSLGAGQGDVVARNDSTQPAGRLLRNWEPDLSPIVPPEVWSIATAPFSEAHFATFPPALVAPCLLAGCPVGGTVIDPFGGAGTTGLVADRMQRSAVLIELNPEYAVIAQRRLAADRGDMLGIMEAEQPLPLPLPTGVAA
ncbi:site-specific DNA-methyltransferase [Sphingomonas sp. T9W2]|uniref:DNA-methyltransferase n=1 Tax=Sphingomonas sp. T9W2 TaxID=3143183 RepID=UPI0031F5846E